METAHLQAGAYDAIVRAIYRSINEEKPWTDPLERLRLLVNANVACIRISEQGSTPHQHLFAAGPMVCPEAIVEWAGLKDFELLPISIDVGEVQVVDWGTFLQSKDYAMMLKKYDIAHMAVMCMDMSDGAQCTLNCSRGAIEGPFSEAELEMFKAVGEHFQQAVKIRRELTRSKIVSQFHTEALDSLGIAAFLVSKSGPAVLLNKTAHFAIENRIGLKLSANKIHTIDEADDSAFQTTLRNSLRERSGSYSRAMLISNGENHNRVHIVVKSHAHPSPLSDQQAMSALIFLRVNEVACDDDIKLLQQLFSFTAKEAKLAIGLANGLCLKDIEAQLNIRHNTARAHLRSMFVKADVSRQSQLVSLLMSSLVPLGRNAHHSLQ